MLSGRQTTFFLSRALIERLDHLVWTRRMAAGPGSRINRSGVASELLAQAIEAAQSAPPAPAPVPAQVRTRVRRPYTKGAAHAS